MIDLKKLRESAVYDSKSEFSTPIDPLILIELLDMLEEAQKDAERYRWIRNPTQDVGLVIDKKVGYTPMSYDGLTGGYGIYEYRAGEELDEAIDVAMKEKE